MLRRAGLSIDSVQTRRFAEVLALLGFERRDDVKAAGRAVFVRRREERAVYDAAFDLFWRASTARGAVSAALPRLRQNEGSPAEARFGPDAPPGAGVTEVVDDSARIGASVQRHSGPPISRGSRPPRRATPRRCWRHSVRACRSAHRVARDWAAAGAGSPRGPCSGPRSARAASPWPGGFGNAVRGHARSSWYATFRARWSGTAASCCASRTPWRAPGHPWRSSSSGRD